MEQKEFQKRCEEVFVAMEGDTYMSISVDGDRVKIHMCEVDGDEEYEFDYVPNMKERPEALDYLLGNRDDFHD